MVELKAKPRLEWPDGGRHDAGSADRRNVADLGDAAFGKEHAEGATDGWHGGTPGKVNLEGGEM